MLAFEWYVPLTYKITVLFIQVFVSLHCQNFGYVLYKMFVGKLKCVLRMKHFKLGVPCVVIHC